MFPSSGKEMRPLGAELPLRNRRGAFERRNGKSNSPSSRQGHDEPACHWDPAKVKDATASKLLSKDEGRRVAANIAKLPELVRKA
jgi:hypothetical protein